MDFKIKGTHINKQERELLASAGLKYCPACKKAHLLSEFNFRKSRPNTLQAYCAEHYKHLDSLRVFDERVTKYTIAEAKALAHINSQVAFKIAADNVSKCERIALRNEGLKWCRNCGTPHELRFFDAVDTLDGLNYVCRNKPDYYDEINFTGEVVTKKKVETYRRRRI